MGNCSSCGGGQSAPAAPVTYEVTFPNGASRRVTGSSDSDAASKADSLIAVAGGGNKRKV